MPVPDIIFSGTGTGTFLPPSLNGNGTRKNIGPDAFEYDVGVRKDVGRWTARAHKNPQIASYFFILDNGMLWVL